MIRVDLESLNLQLDQDAASLERVARSASQAAAEIFYREVRRNALALGQKSGRLVGAIYQAYSAANSGTGHATYHISWNPRKAKHGHLLEHGHIQRYVSYVGSDGNWYTAIRPEMRGKPRPSRWAPQAVKDAYYLRLSTPKQIPAAAFVRRAISKSAQAEAAAATEIMRAIE